MSEDESERDRQADRQVAREYARNRPRKRRREGAGHDRADDTGSGPAIPPRGTPIIEVTDIGKRYGSVIALRGRDDLGQGGRGHLRARRQRRGQVDVHQDPRRCARSTPRGRSSSTARSATCPARAMRWRSGSRPSTRTSPWFR